MNSPNSNPDPGRLNWADYIDELRRSARRPESLVQQRDLDWMKKEEFEAPRVPRKRPAQRKPT